MRQLCHLRQLCHFAAPVSLAVTSLACALGTGTGASPVRSDSGPVEVRVENRSWSDAAIYLVANGLMQRIGLATAGGTTTLMVPASLLGASNEVQIVSAPIGSNRSQRHRPAARPGRAAGAGDTG